MAGVPPSGSFEHRIATKKVLECLNKGKLPELASTGPNGYGGQTEHYKTASGDVSANVTPGGLNDQYVGRQLFVNNGSGGVYNVHYDGKVSGLKPRTLESFSAIENPSCENLGLGSK